MRFINKIFHFLLLFCFLFSSAIASDLEVSVKLYNEKKFKLAFPLIEKDAQSGNAEAQFLLGKMYHKGEGTQQNLHKAVYWYAVSASQGYSKAQNNLANCYADGIGIKKDLKKAFGLYSEAARKGITSAQFNLGMMYREGNGTEKNYEKSFKFFSDAANQGHARSMNALGIAYQFGYGVAIDRNEAVRWYKKAAEKGHTGAMWNLAALHIIEDIDDPKNWDDVHKWYMLGMEHGDRKNAPLGLGLIHLFGSGRYPVDNAKAYSLFTLAAENGRADGWYWLGVMEEYGFGRPQNEEKAMELYKRAANAGVEPAINRLEHGHQDWSLHLFKAIRPLFTPYD